MVIVLFYFNLFKGIRFYKDASYITAFDEVLAVE